ncbi:MAG: hypothetical protein ACRDUX_28110 [Mycobacterium sp.]
MTDVERDRHVEPDHAAAIWWATMTAVVAFADDRKPDYGERSS